MGISFEKKVTVYSQKAHHQINDEHRSLTISSEHYPTGDYECFIKSSCHTTIMFYHVKRDLIIFFNVFSFSLFSSSPCKDNNKDTWLYTGGIPKERDLQKYDPLQKTPNPLYKHELYECTKRI